MPRFPDLIIVKVEPELKRGLGAAASAERTTVAELVRRELRACVRTKLAQVASIAAPRAGRASQASV